jgi:hypothetical protein
VNFLRNAILPCQNACYALDHLLLPLLYTKVYSPFLSSFSEKYFPSDTFLILSARYLPKRQKFRAAKIFQTIDGEQRYETLFFRNFINLFSFFKRGFG